MVERGQGMNNDPLRMSGVHVPEQTYFAMETKDRWRGKLHQSNKKKS